MKQRSLLISALFLIVSLISFQVRGQAVLSQDTEEQLTQTETDSVVLQPFPSTGITQAFSATNSLIIESGRQHLSEETLQKHTAEIDSLFSEINGFLGDSSIVSLEGISVRELDEISNRARAYESRLDTKSEELTGVARQLENEAARVFQTRTRWQLTLEDRAEDEALAQMDERIQRTLFRLDSVRTVLQGDLSQIREGIDVLANRRLQLENLQERIRAQKVMVGENLFKIDMPGFFKDLSRLGDTTLINLHVTRFTTTLKNDYLALKSGYRKPMIVALIFLIGFLVLFSWFKGNYQRLISQEQFKLSNLHLVIIRSPVASSLFVVTLLIRFLLPDLPKTFFSLNVLLVMISITILLIRIVGAGIRTWIIVLMVVYGLEVVNELAYHPGPVVRIMLMLVCFAGLWLFIYLLRKNPFSLTFKYKYHESIYRLTCITFPVFLFIAIIANLVGAFQLAEFLALIPIQIIVLAIGVQMASKLIDTLIYLVLTSKGMQTLNVINEDVEYVHRKIVWLFNLFLWLFFLSRILEIFFVKDVVFAWIDGVLREGKKLGNVDYTVGNILIFFFVIWLSVMITRIISRILEKDVFTRVTTAKGIPQTIILLLRIALITGGFFLAAAAAGMELTNLSIVLGAFSVGIGFGLQNIFNNMVSGLILAFERPIKVGDVVQVGELMGTVKSIGLRSSIVRSFDGSEVIVPNGNLISDQMINWTRSDSNRRMDIRTGVAYGTDPEVVLALMEEIAADHPNVRKTPPPKAYFLEFGDSSLNFRLLAWVHIDSRLETESELMVTINTRLKEAGIEIPFPQRDLHIRSDATKPSGTAKPAAKGNKK